ncbi:MAG: hypothetical protein RBS77_01570 [Candidatus Moranbacteria bacterium]|nr:hypothetical protein [Candidatus Moranbacteria bacterium]
MADAAEKTGGAHANQYRYRVVSKREGIRPKIKTFATLKAAQKRIALLTDPEPWKVLGAGPDDIFNTDTMQTYGEFTDAIRGDMPALEWVRLERREVSPWQIIETVKP